MVAEGSQPASQSAGLFVKVEVAFAQAFYLFIYLFIYSRPLLLFPTIEITL